MAWHTPWMIWLAQAAFIGLVLLIAGCLGVLLCRQPVRRLRLMELTLVACLLAPLLSLCPGVPRLSLGWLRPASEEQAKLGEQEAEGTGQALGQFTEAAALPDGVANGPAAGTELATVKNDLVPPRQTAAGWHEVSSAEKDATPAGLRAASFLPILFLPFVLAVAYGT